ncbi:MAG: hypothetical protein V8R27_03120 [Oscillospiraceae bacterium]
MRRRWMSAILALTMALALTACGGSNSSTGTDFADSTPADGDPRRYHRFRRRGRGRCVHRRHGVRLCPL